MFHWAPKYVADPVNVVADSWNEPGKVGQVFPIRITYRADTHSITVCPLITLFARTPARPQCGLATEWQCTSASYSFLQVLPSPPLLSLPGS